MRVGESRLITAIEKLNYNRLEIGLEWIPEVRYWVDLLIGKRYQINLESDERMKLFKIPTRKPDVYDSDKESLQRRVKELEEVVERYRTKRVGPYKLALTISGPQWNGIVSYLKWLHKTAEKHGPDSLGMCAGSDSGGYGWSSNLESNTSGGLGENESHELPTNNSEDK